jgi:GntR family transcriptional regulator
MTFQENIPIYVQIANDIKDQIIAGGINDGDKLNSIREYSIAYEVTALTLQRALGLLESEGVVETRKGVGSFVKLGVREQIKVRLVEELVGDFIARAVKMGLTREEILQRVKEGVSNE